MMTVIADSGRRVRQGPLRQLTLPHDVCNATGTKHTPWDGCKQEVNGGSEVRGGVEGQLVGTDQTGMGNKGAW